MTTGRHGPQLDAETVLETITTLADAGETIACEGGVHAAAITERVPFARSTVHNRCVELVDDGKLREVRGLKDGRPAVSYLPTEDDERDLRADGGQSTGGTYDDDGLKKYTGMEYECEHCGRTETFDGLAVKTRSPIREDADCGICRMNLVDREAYWTGEIEPDHIWYALPENRSHDTPESTEADSQ